MVAVRLLLLVICCTACGRYNFERSDADGDASDGPTDVSLGDCWPAWRAGTVMLGSPQPLSQLNTVREGDPWLTPDALALYFYRGSPGDFFVATRPDRYTPFGDTKPVDELNSGDDETKLSMTDDMLRVLWSTNRQGSQGYDIWEATRMSTALPFGTPSQSTLGQVNDNVQQFDPYITGDGLRLYLAPLSGPNQSIALATRTTPTGNFAFPVVVDDLGTVRNGDPTLSPDELVIVYSARQTGGEPLNFWYATRTEATALFGNAARVPGINDGTVHDQDPALSFDGCELYFMSQRSGQSALYVALVQ